MTCREPTPPDVTLVAIDVSKRRNDILIELTASRSRKRLVVLNTRPEHDRFIDLLGSLERRIVIASKLRATIIVRSHTGSCSLDSSCDSSPRSRWRARARPYTTAGTRTTPRMRR
jgi:hypothetical protein